MDVKPKTMTTKQAAIVYGASVREIRKMILDGELPAKKVHRDKYIPVAELDRMFL